MASVYLARERALDRFVAIKVLRPDLALAATHRERFRREARTAAHLSHPGILALHSFGEIDNLWYFVMPYVRGETLAEKIRREGPLPWADAHRILSEIADALDCAHRNGVVHRDIKPANILLDSQNGHAMLADFGISKIPGGAESLTSTGAVVGTPDYMSPEQVTAGADIDERSDIYSLGAVGYVMLTGREPFHGENSIRMLYRRLLENAPAISTLAPSVPPDLASVVEKCMARDRNDRWQDTRALSAALNSIIAVNKLPDVVRDLPSFGAYVLLWVGGWSVVALSGERSGSETALLVLLALLAPAGLALHMWSGVRRGMRISDVVRVAFWPPEWWSMWWPRSLRRPSDVWSRLPWVARATRIAISIATAMLLFLIVTRGQLFAGAPIPAERWVTTAEWTIAILAAVVVAVAFILVRKEGVGITHAPTLLLGPTLASSNWSDRQLTRILAPISGTVRPPDPDVPFDYLRAIREMMPVLAGSEVNLAARITAAAECLVEAIDQRDRELESISRDAGPAEADRLSAQLAILAVEEDGDTGERQELRDLVRHQLQLVHRMQSRKEIISRERSHLIEVLRSIWTLMLSSGTTQNSTGVLQRLEKVCADVIDADTQRT